MVFQERAEFRKIKMTISFQEARRIGAELAREGSLPGRVTRYKLTADERRRRQAVAMRMLRDERAGFAPRPVGRPRTFTPEHIRRSRKTFWMACQKAEEAIGKMALGMMPNGGGWEFNRSRRKTGA